MRNFRERVEQLLAAWHEKNADAAWFDTAHPGSQLRTVAYFSMEYMLSEALPIYSGGLGNVAGDQLKAASDLGVPAIGVGLLYQQGYFRQEIDARGEQLALYVTQPKPDRRGEPFVRAEVLDSRLGGRGRDEHRCPPPAQIRTSGITAYGSSLGYERQSGHRDMDEECGDEESTDRR